MPPPQFRPMIIGAFCRFSRNLQDPVIDVPLSPIAAISRNDEDTIMANAEQALSRTFDLSC
jgi:hypothetical protein